MTYYYIINIMQASGEAAAGRPQQANEAGPDQRPARVPQQARLIATIITMMIMMIIIMIIMTI